LRVITAEASRWLLAPGFSVERSGASLMVDGQLVIVDAPCSGVQMLWLAYFTACVVALWAGRSSTRFLARLPAVSVLVLAGNVVRNALLVALEAGGTRLPAWAHDAVGLAVLAAVCAAIAWVMRGAEGERHV
jgi:exosortase/archaeosortase family protein